MTPLLGMVPSLAESPDSYKTFRVLVADDDRGLRTLLSTFLTSEGITVETVATGFDAVQRLSADPPDIAFLDVAMPGKSGLDVLAHIRERKLDTAAVITTAYGSEEVVAEALRRGADDYLSKPFNQADVQAVLDRTIARLLLTRQNAALRQRLADHQHQIEQELARAAQVVAELMPVGSPQIAGYGLAAMCLSARQVGGDFYDWHQLPSGILSLTVGDVMGKGLSAALLMATVRAVLRAVVSDNAPAEVVRRAAATLDGDLARSGAFVTLFHAQVDVRSGRVSYVDAGHGYVLLCRRDGAVEELQPWALPLGVDANERYREGRVEMAPGDTLLIYSDGLGEARPDKFATREGVAAYVRGTGEAADIVRDLMNEVTPVRPLPDDLTVVALRRRPDAA